MALTIGEALAVNTLVKWILGQPNAIGADISGDDALKAAQLLADHANKALHAGIRPEEVGHFWNSRSGGKRGKG